MSFLVADRVAYVQQNDMQKPNIDSKINNQNMND